jgi:hypothetical protein
LADAIRDSGYRIDDAGYARVLRPGYRNSTKCGNDAMPGSEITSESELKV